MKKRQREKERERERQRERVSARWRESSPFTLALAKETVSFRAVIVRQYFS